ncbi:MAG: discoidin domain-containing protein [Bryobacteraceae bacterium]|nr:discoidin domain-containing protein [Bryobacteraceae bacterium]
MLSVLFGAAVTLAAAWCCGQVVVARGRVALTRGERALYALVLGAAVLSLVLFAMAALGVVSDGSLLALAAAACLAAWRWGRTPVEDATAGAPLQGVWRWLFAPIWAIFAGIAVLHTMAPEMSPDGSSYHLGVIARYYRAGGFVSIPHLMYGQMPQGFDILYMMAFAFGRHSAAALVHCGFLLALPWLLLRIGQRAGHAAAGAAAGLLVMLSPVVLIDGASAYNDVALAVVAVAAFGLALRKDTPAWCVGLLAGFAFTIKYTAFVAAPWLLLLTWRRGWRAQVALAGAAGAVVAPWLLRNAMLYGNPVAPFYSKWFPNAFMHESFEESYRAWMAWYDGLERWSQVPWALTVDGGVLGGLLGPVFLLAPVALLAARSALGRRALLAAFLFGLPWVANVGTRFLIPALPFAGLALALALPGRVLPALVVLHALASLPPVVDRYAGEHAWRIKELYPRVALRLEDPKAFMAREWPPFRRAALIESATGEGAVVAVGSPVPESYTSRETRVLYLSAQGERVADLLLTPLIREFQPLHRFRFEFEEQALRAVRVVQTAQGEADIWNISEMNLHTRDGVLPRGSGWGLRASAFPWDVGFAFDGSPVTRWRSWRALRAGDWIEVDLGASRRLTAVTLDMATDQWSAQMKLEGLGADGQWRELGAAPVRTERPPPLELRRMAVEELKRMGITHVMVVEGDRGWEDFRDNADLWGISEAGRVDDTRLYRLE